MAYFDYSTPQLPDYSEGLRYLGDALAQAAARRQQRQQHEEQMQFNREQEDRKFTQAQMNIDYQNRIIDERSKQARIKFSQQQNEYRQRQMDAARKAVADGNPQLAQAILDQTRMYDPATGEETGRGSMSMGPARDVGAPPVMPMAPEPSTLEGPQQAVETDFGRVLLPTGYQLEPGHARYMKESGSMPLGAAMDRPGASAQRETQLPSPEHDVAMRRFDAESQGYAERARQAENDRPVTFKFGADDPGVTFTRGQQRYSSRQSAADDFANSLASVPMSPDDRASAAQIHAGILNGTIDPGKAGALFQKERLGIQDRGFKGEQGDLNRQNRLDVQELKNKAPRPSFNLDIAKFKYGQERDRSRFLRDDKKQFLIDNAAKEIAEANRDSANLQANLASGEPGTIRNGLLKLWQIAQKDTRMSDKDAVLANNLDQSVLSQLEGWVTKGAEGVPGDMNLKAAQDTAKRLRGYYITKNEELKKLFRSEFIDSGQYDPKEADVLGAQTFPGWQRVFPDQAAPKGRGTSGRRGGPPEVNAKRKAKSSALDDEAMR